MAYIKNGLNPYITLHIYNLGLVSGINKKKNSVHVILTYFNGIPVKKRRKNQYKL